MRLFIYYAFHTAVNSLKKLLKTWVAFIIVISLGAGLVGLLFGKMIPLIINGVTETESVNEAVEEEIDEYTENHESKLSVFLDERGLDKYDVIDVIVTAIFFFIVTMCLTTVNKGGQIFKPADVPLLFASPMKPQSVLMFRLINSLGANIFVAVYMIFQIPNFMKNFHFSLWGSAAILIGYAFVLLFSTLLQVGFYVVACRKESGSLKIAPALLTFYILIAGGFLLYTGLTHEDPATAAFHFFASKKTFWIPFLGWLRGMIYYALIGENIKSIIYMAILFVSIVVIILIIWNVNADFYENAMFATEKIAAQLENQRKASQGGVGTRNKDRSDKLERDGFHYGTGAGVFFYKAIYNRFRFAKFGIFTVKFVIYLFSAGIAAYFARNINNKDIAYLIPAVIVMMIAYFGSIGNPLQEDTSREFFILIPETPFKKVWASLLGCMAVNAIDIIIPMIVAEVFIKANPLTVLVWFVFILSVTLFGSTVGTFINLSVPGDHSETFKAMLQVIIVYFGSIPSLGFVVAGLALKNIALLMIPGILLNVAIGLLFTALSTKFLGNG